MKKLLVGILCFLGVFIVKAEPVTGFADKSEVVETGMTKSEMWVNLKTWVSMTFNSYEYTVDMEDQESGTLIVKWAVPLMDSKDRGSWVVPLKLTGTGYGIIKVEVKDKKYRWSDIGCQITIEDANDFDYRNLKGDYNVPNQIVDKLQSMELELSTIPKYKNAKDESKDKVNKDFSKLESQITMLSNILASYVATNDGLISSLQKAMIVKDDF